MNTGHIGSGNIPASGINIFFTSGCSGNFLGWNTIRSIMHARTNYIIDNTVGLSSEEFNEYSFNFYPVLESIHVRHVIESESNLNKYKHKTNFVITTSRETSVFTNTLVKIKHQMPDNNNIAGIDEHTLLLQKIPLLTSEIDAIELDYYKMFIEIDESYICERYLREFSIKREAKDMFISNMRRYTSENFNLVFKYTGLKKEDFVFV